MDQFFPEYLAGTQAALADTRRLIPQMQQAADEIVTRLEQGGTIYFLGNGGSASDAQHLAAELLGKFSMDRAPLRSVCLNTDTSVITAVANDFGYDQVFARQVQALAGPGDVVVLISTSGESSSVLAACDEARAQGSLTIGLTGLESSSLANSADIPLAVGRHATCHVQEAHIAIGQAICGYVERRLFS